MRRSSSINVPRDNPRLATSSLVNKSHTQETESFCYDKLESAHFEAQGIHTQLESLIIKMKNDANVQNTFKAEQGFIRLKKDDFVLYYNQLKNIYRSMKKLTGNWDALFDDFSTMHTHSIAKRNKEVESLSKYYKYKLKALEFEKKSALEVQKNDLLRREQEVLDSVNSFLNSLKGTKKFWDNGINELQFFVKEHAQSLDYLANHKAAKLKAFGEEIDSMFNDIGQHKGFGTPSNNVEILSTDRNREYVELINNLSPINQELPKISGMRLLNKSKEDLEALSSKRGKDQAIETSNNSYEELFAYNNNKGHNGGGQMQEQSIEREEGGWDPNLEDEDSTEGMEMDRIEKALELLFQNGLLDQYAVGMFEQIMQNTKESGLDREIQMNLFKDMIKLQLRKNKKVEKNQDFPLMKKTGKVSARNEQSIKESHLESGLHRKSRGEFSATAGHLRPTNPELVFTVPLHYQTIVTHQPDESISKNSGFRGSLHLPQTCNNNDPEDKNKPVRAKKQHENRRKKNDISLSDLLGVKEYSFELESPLSIHASREEHYSSVPRFRHVEKEDLLKADSLPVTLKEGDMVKVLADRKRMSTLQEDLLHGSLMNNTRKKELADDNKQGRNQNQIKIIEEFKNSVENSSDTHPRLIEESYESSDKSSPYLSSRKRELLQDDDTQLEWETNIESKGEISRRSKAPSNLSTQRPLHGSTTAILKERLIDSNSPDPYQNLLIKENTLPRPQIQTSQEIKNRPFTMNTTDIKLSSIDTSPKLVNHNNSIKGNPVRRLANKSILRNSPLTGSSHTRVSTKANTGFNEVDSTDNAHMTLYSSMNHTMPIIRLIDNFSHIVETEGGADEKSSHHFLNRSFPPYYDTKDQGKKHSLTKFSKKPESYTSKAVTTSGSKWGSKNLIPNNGYGFRGSKVFINGRSRSETNLWPRQENIISETEELIFQK